LMSWPSVLDLLARKRTLSRVDPEIEKAFSPTVPDSERSTSSGFTPDPPSADWFDFICPPVHTIRFPREVRLCCSTGALDLGPGVLSPLTFLVRRRLARPARVSLPFVRTSRIISRLNLTLDKLPSCSRLSRFPLFFPPGSSEYDAGSPGDFFRSPASRGPFHSLY